MTDQDTRATGSCLCGAVRFEVRGPLRDVMLCHCGQCRRAHGHIAAYSSADRDDLVFHEEASLTWYRSSDKARRGFCATCGSSLFWEPEGEGRLAISAGCLDEPTGLTCERQIFVADAGDYYRVADDLPGDDGSHYRS